jgi:hypothetical protein
LAAISRVLSMIMFFSLNKMIKEKNIQKHKTESLGVKSLDPRKDPF